MKHKTNSLKSFWIRFITYFGWKKINNPPKWVINKAQGYYEYFIKKYKMLPYFKTKYFKGKNFVYKVYYDAPSQGTIEEIYYARKR